MGFKHFGIRKRSGRYPWGEGDHKSIPEYYSKPSHVEDLEDRVKEPEYVSSLSLDELKKKAEELNAKFDDIGESVTDELWTMSGINDWVGNVFELINQINALEKVEN